MVLQFISATSRRRSLSFFSTSGAPPLAMPPLAILPLASSLSRPTSRPRMPRYDAFGICRRTLQQSRPRMQKAIVALVIESSVVPRAGAAAVPVIGPPAQAEGDIATSAVKTLVHTEGNAAVPVIESSVRRPGRKYPLGIAQRYRITAGFRSLKQSDSRTFRTR